MAWNRFGVALLRIPSMTTSMFLSGTPVSCACFSIRVTPQDEMPARKASPLVIASLGPEGESRTKCCWRALLRERPSTPLEPDRTVSILTPSVMRCLRGPVRCAADDAAGRGPCQARYHRCPWGPNGRVSLAAHDFPRFDLGAGVLPGAHGGGSGLDHPPQAAGAGRRPRPATGDGAGARATGRRSGA